MKISKNRQSEDDPRGHVLRGAGRDICFLNSSKGGFFASFALALLCLTAPAGAPAEELGRLFFTPQQREDLDRRRATNRAEEEAPPQIKEGPLTLNGQVQRSSGRTTTWINGAPQYDNPPSRDPARVTVVPNEGEPGVSLKVGETYERAGGAIRDRLNGGEVKVGKSSRQSQPVAPRGAATTSPAPAR
jgi:hypothetical protein